MGRTVATLAAGVREAGPHAVLWEGTDERGVPLGSGVYLCGVRFDGRLSTQMVSLIR
jgi:hypothetical protein